MSTCTLNTSTYSYIQYTPDTSEAFQEAFSLLPGADTNVWTANDDDSLTLQNDAVGFGFTMVPNWYIVSFPYWGDFDNWNPYGIGWVILSPADFAAKYTVV